MGYSLEVPSPGAVMVYSRTGGGHVTLYESEDANYYYCRGGNQSDSVNVSKLSEVPTHQSDPLACRRAAADDWSQDGRNRAGRKGRVRSLRIPTG
jgi:hypothetical protein